MADQAIEKDKKNDVTEERKASGVLSQEFSERKTVSSTIESASGSNSDASKSNLSKTDSITKAAAPNLDSNSTAEAAKPDQKNTKDTAAPPAPKPVKIEDNPSGDQAPKTQAERKAAEQVYFDYLYKSKNFKLDQFLPGEGPEQVLLRMNADNKLGKVPWTYEQIHKEARRISHRDLNETSKPSYSVGEQAERWTSPEITKKVEQTLNKTRGIDVSHWDNDIDWKQVADSGVKFAFLKTTGAKRDGTTVVDAKFEQNRDNATANGINLGYYHFFRPDADMKEQIELFAKTIGKPDNKLPIVMDVEEDETKPMWKTAPDGHEYTSAERVKIINEFCDGLKKMLGADTRIALYLNPRFARENLGENNSSLGKYELWLANWRVPEMVIPAPWKKAQFWQYAGDTGKVAGIEKKGGADLDLVMDDAYLNAPRKRKH